MNECFKLESVRGYTAHQRRVQLTPPPMPEKERNRLAGLAKGLMGCSTFDPDGYILTPVRAKKCVMLYGAGFEYVPNRLYHMFRRIDQIAMHLHDAVAIAKKTVSKNT